MKKIILIILIFKIILNSADSSEFEKELKNVSTNIIDSVASITNKFYRNYYLAEIYFKEHDILNALYYYNTALIYSEDRKKRIAILWNIAILHRDNKNYIEAIESLKRIALLGEQSGARKTYEEIIDEVIGRNADSNHIDSFNTAYSLFENEKYEEAKNAFNNIPLYKSFYAPLYYEIIALFKLRLYEEALEKIKYFKMRINYCIEINILEINIMVKLHLFTPASSLIQKMENNPLLNTQEKNTLLLYKGISAYENKNYSLSNSIFISLLPSFPNIQAKLYIYIIKSCYFSLENKKALMYSETALKRYPNLLQFHVLNFLLLAKNNKEKLKKNFYSFKNIFFKTKEIAYLSKEPYRKGCQIIADFIIQNSLFNNEKKTLDRLRPFLSIYQLDIIDKNNEEEQGE